MVKKWFEEKGEKADLVVPTGMQSSFEKLSVEFITSTEFNKREHEEKDNYIFFHHGNEGTYNFFIDIVTGVVKKSENKNLNVSFLPDGLGNTMWGESFIDRYNAKNSESSVKLLYAFGFGFEHETTLKKFGSVTNVEYSYLTDFLDTNKYLVELCENVINEMDLGDSNVILPYRPWCTSSFHGGVYDIGDNKYLANIYLELLKIISISNEQPKVFFRGDTRYPVDCGEIFKAINDSIPCSEIGSDYPTWLTLEPLMYFLLNKNKVYNFLVLDSTTFQAVPFLMNNSQSEVAAVIGCPTTLLSLSPVGGEFINRKLKYKINDFKNRFELFNSTVPLEINTIDSCCFSVKIS
jgi:hypothetical protein